MNNPSPKAASIAECLPDLRLPDHPPAAVHAATNPLAMKAITLLSLAAASLSSACATKGADPLCEPLRGFVASVEPNQSHELAYHTRWGASFKNDPNPDTIAAKYCEHKRYAPAQSACLALMEHGAIEFSNITLQRALVCLAPGTQFGHFLQVRSGTFTLQYGDDERGSLVSIEFVPDAEMGGMVLRVEAKGY